ncbi:MAG: CotH kinase family protein, partial [Eudoraea sp.]|uniref:CotH kinase family protein n=1 Tax=Eudoraea sp. TaxID=1979955 RepID=UPI003C7820D7
YKEIYDNYVQEVVDGPFNTASMQSLYNTYSSLIEPYATIEESGYSFLNTSSDFQTAINVLNMHVEQRTTAVSNYLD